MLRFMQMLAHNHGRLWNASGMARSLEIGASTAGRYLDAIQQTLLVRRLSPHHQNVGKRLTKSPKTYVRDSGVLHALLGLRTGRDVRGHPVAGYSWEGFVLEQLAAVLTSAWDVSFWRTSAGAEIDILVRSGGLPAVAIEAKANVGAPAPGRGFHIACDDLNPEHRWVVYPGDRVLRLGSGVVVLPLGEAAGRLARMAS
jgi:predicted AAA+ superfamily ATPase